MKNLFKIDEVNIIFLCVAKFINFQCCCYFLRKFLLQYTINFVMYTITFSTI